MNEARDKWQQRIATTLPKARQIISDLGFELDEVQPDLIGEKFLMKTSKFVLWGRDKKNNAKVIIKISDTPVGRKDIDSEEKAAKNLTSLSFSTSLIRTPRELFFGDREGWTILVCEFLEQKETFTKMSLEEQYYIALRAFSVMEEFQITTHEHKKEINGKFKLLSSKDYIEKLKIQEKHINTILNDVRTKKILNEANKFLSGNKKTIDLFGPYMVHEDFVPHNFRIKDNVLYFLDAEAVQFGNKHESWARFLNFMIFHSPALEKKLSSYVKEKGEDEYLSLRLMRVAKATQLLRYYVENLGKTTGDENTLTRKRIEFWTHVIEHLLLDKEIHQSFIEEYKNARDSLRSEEEKQRQKLSKIS